MEKMGSVTCVFLVGNNHGKSVAAWRREVLLHCPGTLIDCVVVPAGKEEADTELIGKMFAFRNLFSTASADVFVASRDSNIIAAGRMLESAGFAVHYSVDRCNKKTGEISRATEYPPLDECSGDNLNPDFWLEHLENTCKIFWSGKKRYSNLSDVGNVLKSAGLDSAGRIRVLHAAKSKGAVVDKKDGRFYFSSDA